MSKPLFITLEGGEGVGKTTNLEFICDWLNARDIDFIRTREPGGTPLSELVRELLLQVNETESWCPNAELLLVFAARAQHLDQVIKPAIEAGKTVVCDRFTDATYAYQGYGRQLDLNVVRTLESLVQNDFQPNATLLLDAPVSVGMARAEKRAALDRFEQEKQDFFESVRKGYLARAQEHSKRFKIIDASKSLIEVKQSIAQVLAGIFDDVD